MLSKSFRTPRKSLLGFFPSRSNLLNRHAVLDQQQLSALVKRERMRMLRRGIGFCLLLFQRPEPVEFHALEKLLIEFRDRLRITDDLGVLEHQLVVVLPDTDREGGKLVANDLLLIARRLSLDLDCELVCDESDDESNNDGSFAHRPHFETSVQDATLVGRDPESPQAVVAVLPKLERRLAKPLAVRSGSKALFVQPVSRWKRSVDILGASVGLVVLSPVIALASVAILRESEGSVFFRQLREGKDGKPFWIYKFRTMQDGAESLKESLRPLSEQDGPAFKMSDDPRVTPVGRFLRRTCIDELPQLLNVLRGEMSLVGPRPLPVDESQACEPWQRQRLEVLPGLTCTWQVSGGRSIPFQDWMRMDLSYLRHQSLLYDLSLILRTALVALRMRGSV